MEIIINYWAVLLCAVLALVVGAIWHGPFLFGKKYAQLMKMDTMNPEMMKAKQKEMYWVYAVQFALFFFQAYVLAHYVAGWTEVSGLENALWIWAGFVMPILATNVMWTGDSKKVIFQKFFILAGYQLVMFVIYGLVLGMWR